MKKFGLLTLLVGSLLVAQSTFAETEGDSSPNSSAASAATDSPATGVIRLADRGDKGKGQESAAKAKAAKAKAGDGGGDRDAARKLLGQMREKYMKLRQLREDGKEDEAAKVEAELRKMREQVQKQMAGRGFPGRGPRPSGAGPQGSRIDPAKMKERREMMEKMMSQFRKYRQLKEDGKDKEAEAVRAEMQELREKAAKLGGPPFAGPWQGRRPGSSGSDRPSGRPDIGRSSEVRAKFAELHKKMQAARESGDEKKVEAVKKEFREQMSKMWGHHASRGSHHGHHAHRGHSSHGRRPGGGDKDGGKKECEACKRGDCKNPACKKSGPKKECEACKRGDCKNPACKKSAGSKSPHPGHRAHHGRSRGDRDGDAHHGPRGHHARRPGGDHGHSWHHRGRRPGDGPSEHRRPGSGSDAKKPAPAKRDGATGDSSKVDEVQQLRQQVRRLTAELQRVSRKLEELSRDK